ncbi:MAG: methyltransferase domain-containing protein, partial [Acidimicrobiales bacterium]
MTAIEELPPVAIPGHRASGLGSDDHPMRIMTRRAAGLAPGGWDAEARGQVEALFDELSGEWHTRTSPQRRAVVVDALDRGGVTGGRLAVELGSGIGNYSSLLAERFHTVGAVDLSLGMLRLAPAAPAARLQADAADLPFQAGCPLVRAPSSMTLRLHTPEVDHVTDGERAPPTPQRLHDQVTVGGD